MMYGYGLPFDEYPVLATEPARTWLFTVIMTPPTTVMGGNAADGAHLELTARSANLPQMSIKEVEDKFMNQIMYHATKYAPESATFSFLVSMNAQNVLKILYEWNNLISNWTSTYTTGYAKDYKTDIRVKVWEHKGLLPILTYVLVRAWPTGVSSVKLEYSDDSIMKLDATFRFDRWYIEQ